jgi:tetratricopeptide (TPR) repeat protein
MIQTDMLKFLKSHLGIFVLFLALSFVLYGNSIPGDFVWDDKFFAARQELKDPSHLLKVWSEAFNPSAPHLGTYRPFTVFTISLNFILFGESPISFHIVNIILNGLAAWLMYRVVLELFSSKRIALASSLLWLFFPIHTEAVANIKSRDEILGAIFIFSAWWAFLKSFAIEYPRRIWWIILGAILLYLAGMSKDMGIVGGLTILGVLIYQTGWNIRGLAIEIASIGAAGLAWLVTRYAVLGTHALGSDQLNYVSNPLKIATAVEKFWTPFKILFVYIQNTLIPYNLSATYHFNQVPLVSNPFASWQTLTGIILLGIFLIAVAHKKYRELPLGIGAWIFLSSYIPISRFVFASGGDMIAERWMYFPSAGIAIIFGYLFVEFYKKYKQLALGVLCALLLIYAGVIITRNQVWLSDKALYDSMVHDAPQSVVGYLASTIYYIDHNDIEKSKQLIEKAFTIHDKEPIAWDLAATINYKIKNYNRAIEQASIALSFDPAYTPALLTLAKTHFELREYNLTRQYYEKAAADKRHQSTASEVLIYTESLIRTKSYREALDFLNNKKFAERIHQERAYILVAAAYYYVGPRQDFEAALANVPGQSRAEKMAKITAFLRNAPRD